MGMNKMVVYGVNGDGECEVRVIEDLMNEGVEIDLDNVWYGRVDWCKDVKFEKFEELIDELDDVDENEREKWKEFVDVVYEFEVCGEFYLSVKNWSYDGSGWYVGVMCVSVL